jgi:single-strand DNA-binding protein
MLSGNQVVLVGRAVGDAQTKKVGSTQVTSFRVVTNRYVKKKNGEGEEKATYVDCEAWEKRSEYAESRVKKGVGLLITGRLESDEWTDKQTGAKRSRLKVYVENLQVDAGKNGGGKAKAPSEDEGQGEDANEPVPASDGADLPF